MPALLRRCGLALLPLALGACAGDPVSLVTVPTVVRPPAPVVTEAVKNGSIFQPHFTTATLFSGERPARSVGDVVKVEISETHNATQSQKNETRRENKLSAKGPGSSAGGLYGKLMNMEATASGADSFKGDGSTESATHFTGQVAAQVINVLPNGHLVVAGERSIGMNGGVSTLRFSGVVDPRDLKAGNVIASADAADARVELVSKGDLSEASRRSWLQRVLTRTLSVW